MRLALAVLAGFALAGCGPQPPPEPSPPPRSETRPLRPLTSRDEAVPRVMPPGASELPPGHPMIGGPAPATAATEAVSGTIAIAPALRGKQAATDTLFIVARSAGGGQVLAVRKEEDARLPRAFTISGADAMVTGTAFAGPFDITARLSKSGDAIPAAGDLEGTARGVASAARGVVITVDRVRP